MYNVYLVENHEQKLIKSHFAGDSLYRYAKLYAKKTKSFLVFKGIGFSMTIDGRFN